MTKAIIILAIGIVVGFLLGRVTPKNLTIFQFLRKIYINLENFVLIISALVVGISIYLSTIGELAIFATTTINIFGSIVFSWLLTKKSSKIEFKDQEEQLALRSFRHINYIDSAANTTYKQIEQYAENIDKPSDEEMKLILKNIMGQIKYIQGGIRTCKMDWHDMLSEVEREHYKNTVYDLNDEEDYGTVEVVIPVSEYNQEDA